MDISNIIHIKAGVYQDPEFQDPLGAISKESSFVDFNPTLPTPFNIKYETSIDIKNKEKPFCFFNDRIINDDYDDSDDSNIKSIQQFREFREPPKTKSDEFFDPGVIHQISITNAIFLPFNFIDYIKSLYRSIKTTDKEAVLEYLIKIFNTPIGMAEAYQSIYSMACVFFNIVNAGFSKIIFGPIFLAIELCLEVARLIRTIQFRNSIHPLTTLNLIKELDFYKLKKENIDLSIKSLNDLEYRISYFNPESETAKKIRSITTNLSKDIELSKKIKIASEQLEELKLNLAIIALSSIYENYLLLSEKEIEQCKSKALKNCDFKTNDLEFTKKDPSLFSTEDVEKFNQYQQYFEYEKKLLLKGKRSALGRRVCGKMLNELETKLTSIFNMHSYYNEHRKEIDQKDSLELRSVVVTSSRELLKKLDVQSKKTILVHVIGISTIFLGIVVFLGGSVAFPQFLPALSFLFSTFREYAPKAFLDSNEYKFNFSSMLPNFLNRKKNPKRKKLKTFNVY